MIRNFSGVFITLEGGEGAGKSSLLLFLAEKLRERGLEVVVTREPGGSLLGEKVRSLLLEAKEEEKIADQSELLLFLAARAQHIEQLIKPALEEGKIVICDRFNDSTIAYQGGARGLGVQHVEKLCLLVSGEITPQLTLLLKVSPEEGLKRSKGMTKENAPQGELDRIEKESLLFHKKIEETFDYLAQKESSRIHTINANSSKEDVFNESLEYVSDYLFRNHRQ